MPDNTVPAGPWAEPVSFIGGDTGGNWGNGACGWVEGVRGQLVKRLDIWWDDHMRGMRVVFADNTESPVYGWAAPNNYASITFNPNPTATDPGPERVTEMWMCKSDNDRLRLGRIRIKTNRGQNWEQGVGRVKDWAQINVGTGLFVGMIGRYGADIDAAAALFLRSPVVKLSVGNITYSPDPRGTDRGLNPVAINEGHYSNPVSAQETITWEFGGDQSRQVTMSHDMTTTNTYGGSVGVELSGEVFGIGPKATGGFEWSSQKSQTSSVSTSETITLKWAISGRLEPGKSVTCKAIVQRGALDLNYSANVKATLKDGTVFTYPESGLAKMVSYSGVRTEVVPAGQN